MSGTHLLPKAIDLNLLEQYYTVLEEVKWYETIYWQRQGTTVCFCLALRPFEFEIAVFEGHGTRTSTVQLPGQQLQKACSRLPGTLAAFMQMSCGRRRVGFVSHLLYSCVRLRIGRRIKLQNKSCWRCQFKTCLDRKCFFAEPSCCLAN